MVGKILREFQDLVGPHRAIISPIDVFVDRHNVLQPDVLVLSREDEALPGDREAAMPILVVQVLSPSTEQRDRNEKVAIYLRAGVTEVWLVNPDSAAVEIHRSRGVEYFRVGDRPESEIVSGFRLDLTTLISGSPARPSPPPSRSSR